MAKSKSWLLTKIPDDIVAIVRDHQAKKMKECNCSYGVGQAIFHLLRKAYGKGNGVNLKDGQSTNNSAVPTMR